MRLATRGVLAAIGAACMLAAGALLPPGIGPVRAADYRLVTDATYTVRPADEAVAVSLHVTFRNTTPNPPDRFSVFEVIDLAIHEGARDVRANDRRGRLRVSIDRAGDLTVASVRPRHGVRFRETVEFTLRYTLPDGASPDVRIRPSVVLFPVWSFGTQGKVQVTVPRDFEVQLDGDTLDASRQGDRWVLSSGTIEDPTRWLSLLTATQAAIYATVTRRVELDGQPLEIQVRSWSDDRAWGRRTADLAAEALPLLQDYLGLDLPAGGIEGGGGLVLVESLPSSAGELSEPTPAGSDIAVGFDEPPFTMVHQLAHAWLTPAVASDRWIREGFASSAAAHVAGELDLERPFDPATLAKSLDDAAFPLASWGAGPSSARQDRYAHAAAWLVADRLEEAVGPDAVRQVWQRFAAGLDGYAPADAALPPNSGLPSVAADSRHLLDQLAAVSDADVANVFRDWVLDPASAELLPARSLARQAADELRILAGDWGLPDPVRLALAGWRFDDARAAIAEATSWLADREALLTEMEAAGLQAPQRLRDEYRTSGGTSAARAELDAELEVVRGYAEARRLAAASRSPVDQVGLLGQEDAGAMLDDARLAFAEGDLVGARELVQSALDRLQQAGRDGLIRLASLIAVVVALVVGMVWLARRRGTARSARYTAGP
jgi:hypothetical protein